MSDYLTVSIVTKNPRKPDDKARWTKVGAAFPNKIGGYNIVVDHAITIIPGGTELVLATPKEKEESGGF